MTEFTVYKYDGLLDNEIRLFRLRPGDSKVLEGELVQCRLPPTRAEHNTSTFLEQPLVLAGDYDALSYTWGGGIPTSFIIIYDAENPRIAKGRLAVKPNLEAALKVIRAAMGHMDGLQYLWIDAICINQENSVEKSVQIPMMTDIYGKADIVRIWLGPGTEQTSVAMDFITELVEMDDIDKLSASAPTDFKWAAFRDLMRRPWFHRRWIIQEIALARNAVVYCGDKFVPWETFTYAVSLFTAKASELKWLFQQSRSFEYDPDFLGEMDALGAKTLVDLTNNISHRNEDGEVVEYLYSLEGLMSTLTMFEASNPHDIVYSILSLAHDSTPVPVKSIQEETEPVIIGSLLIESPSLLSVLSSPQERGRPQPQRNLVPGERNIRRRRSLDIARGRDDEPLSKDPRRFEINYDKDYLEVCCDFIRFVVESSHSLNIILLPWAPTPPEPSEALPSWIPHISGRAYDLLPHSNVYQRVNADPLVGSPGAGLSSYRACGRLRALFSVQNEAQELYCTVRGFSLGTIDEIGEKATHGSIPSSWLDLAGWEDPSSPLPQAFWRTIVADRDLDGRSPPPAYFPLACKWAFKRRVPGYDLITWKFLRQSSCPTLCATFLKRMEAVVWDRKLAILSSKQSLGALKKIESLALVPAATKEGDLICILYGSSVPVVLRRKQTEQSQSNKKRRISAWNNRRDITKLGNPQLKRRRLPPLQLTPSHNSDEGHRSRSGILSPPESQPLDSMASIFLSSPSITDSPPSLTLEPQPIFPGPRIEKYEVIGACYVHGMMMGEAFGYREDTGSKIEDFVLV